MKNWSLNQKIYFILGIFIFASALISFTGLRKMSEIKDSLSHIVVGPVAQSLNANRLHSLYGDQQISVRNIILVTTPEEKEARKKVYDDGHQKILALIKDSSKVADEEGKKDLENFTKIYNTWVERNVPIIKAGMENNHALAVVGLKNNSEIRAQMDALIQDEIARTVKDTEAFIQKSEEDYSTAKTMMLVMSLVSLLSGLTLAFFILRSISAGINTIIAELTSNTSQVTEASQNIATSSVQLSDASVEQAAALEETAASIQEMSSMVQKNAENAKRTSELAVSSNDNALHGKSVVDNMIHSIDEISTSNTTIMNQINDSNQKISDIVKVIAEIGSKTKVINDIVFQTKLLSFNASVEAARAGEHGKGFAVVAEEVGNLAQMSGNAAQEISEMLDGSIQKVEGIVNETKEKVGRLIQDGRHKIEEGSKIARECGSVLDEIVHNFASVSSMASEITTACVEQSQGVQEITKAMNSLDHTTQNNAMNSKETAVSAEKLSSQASSLNHVVEVLRKTIEGNHRAVTVETKRVSHHTAKVLPLKKTTAPKKQMPAAAPMKKAVGGFDQVPDVNDSRFEDV